MSDAVHRGPGRPKNNVNTEEMGGPKAPDIVVPATGSFSYDDYELLEVVRDAMADKKDWADKMRFAQEIIKIRINETSDPNAELRVPVCVNGVLSHPVYGNHLPRGIEIDVKRYVAEQLLRTKPIGVKTVQVRDHDGADTAKIIRTVGNAYPFEVIGATSRDTDWMRSIRAQV